MSSVLRPDKYYQTVIVVYNRGDWGYEEDSTSWKGKIGGCCHQVPEEAAAASSQSEDEVEQPGLPEGQEEEGSAEANGVELTEEEAQIKDRLLEVMEAARVSQLCAGS